MSSVSSDSSSFRKSLSVFEKRQRNKSFEPSPSKKALSMLEHRQSLGSCGSLEVPPAFRVSLNIFEDGEERNPLLPSFFRDDEGNIVQKPVSANNLKKEFEFSMKHTKVQEGPSLSVQQIIGFQSRIRGYLERKVHKKRQKFIMKIQALGRGFLQRKIFHSTIQASIQCQSIVRRYLVQREARRLYDTQNPPHIRKLRNQIAAIQLKLDAINDERECIKRERERRKAQIKKECLERFAKMERDKTLSITQVQKTGSQLISYFQTENNALRATMKELALNIADLRSENKSLEFDNHVVAQYTHELHTHYKKMKDKNGSLKNQVDKLRNHLKPKWECGLAERENHAINETRQKYVYRQGLFRIVDTILLGQSYDPDFKVDIARVIGRCEDDFGCKLDIDTPREFYPTPPEQKSMISAFKTDDEKSVIDAGGDEHFEFIDDADFLLPGLKSFDSSIPDYSGPCADDANSTSPSASSSSCSDSSSSTDSSNSTSQDSDNSFRRRPADSCESKEVVKYFERNNASTFSPIAKKHDIESTSTACSTDESEFEIQSVSDSTECYDTGKIAVNDDVESESESGTATSIPPWGATNDPNVPAFINIPSSSKLEGKVHVENQSEALTFVSTESTVAIESETSSSYADTDVMYSRNGIFDESALTTMLEIAENEQVDKHLSRLHSKEPASIFLQQSGGTSGLDAKEDLRQETFPTKHFEMQKAKSQGFKGPTVQSVSLQKPANGILSASAAPKVTTKPQLAELGGHKQQRFKSTAPASARSQQSTPFRARKPSTKATGTGSVNPVANPKPFRARPAPKFGEPKIPVRVRDPGKLRSTSKARSSMSPQKSR